MSTSTNRSKLLVYGIGAWVAIEVLAFVFVVHFLGVIAAVALGLGTTLVGLLDIKRLVDHLRTRLGLGGGKSERAPASAMDGGLQAFGTLLLILPGYVSDLVGLALKAPSIRSDIAKRLSEGPQGPRTIDLAPTEWKAIGHGGRRRRNVPVKTSDA